MPNTESLHVRHFLCDFDGGIRKYVEALTKALEDSGEISQSVFGPKCLDLPKNIGHIVYRPTSPWGLNQWWFAANSAFHRPGTAALLHTHVFHFFGSDVHTVHGFYGRNWLAKYGQSASPVAKAQFSLLSRLERSSIESSRHVIFVSSENKKYAEDAMGLHNRNSHVIHPGVDSALFSPKTDSEKQALRRKLFPQLNASARWCIFSGNDFLGKGLLSILAAFRENRLAEPMVLLAFGSDPAHETMAKELAAQVKNLQTHFGTYASPQEGARFMQLADAFIMDSRSEGFPLTLAESMASGCVPFVTPFGGVDDIVTAKNGVVSKDSSALVRSMLQMDQNFLKGRSQEAAKTARALTWANVAKRVLEVYREAKG
jgi:glycosyltransferase involved in cell wall biosynthesis